MVRITGGPFVMGDSQGGPDETLHCVTVDSFYIDRYLVTQQMYEKVMGKNPAKNRGDKLPVEQVQWVDAARFCNRCSQLDGLSPCYDPKTWACDFTANGYRLPTEAEWEFACRAGTDTQYFFGDNVQDLPKYAWYKPHSRGHSHPVGTRRPNPWGLHDMLGNVFQWCNDFYSSTYYEQSPAENPRGPATGKRRVLRGGSWKSTAAACRPASRQKEFPVFTDACFGADSYGLRRVRSVVNTASQTSDQTKQTAITEPLQDSDETVGRPADTVSDKDVGSQSQKATTPPQQPAGAAMRGETDITVQSPGPHRPSTLTRSSKISPQRLIGRIVFVSDRAGNLDLWTMCADGSKMRALTDDTHPDADPRFSPDGTRISYTTLRKGFPEIWLMQSDGSQPTRVTDGSQAAWSPDGKSLVFIRDDQVMTRELGSGNEHRLTPDTWQRCGVPAWSRDGHQIALASRHEATIGVYLLGIDGGSPKRLPTEDPCCTPRWSPDGKSMVFQTTKGHIHLWSIADRVAEQLTTGAAICHDAAFSPDGTLLAFSRAPTADGPWQICILDLDSDDLDVIQITQQGSNRQPDWQCPGK